MSFQNESHKTNTLAVGGALDPQDVQQTNASGSRLVIRDKSSAEPHQTYTGQTFPIVDTERATLQMGRRKNSVELVFHPIPDKSASRTNAHVDWLGLTVTPPEGKPIQWVFHELQNAFGLSVTKIRNAGWNGYLHRADIGRFGLVAWGGKAQRGTVHIEINGMGCAHIEDWQKIESWGNQDWPKSPTSIELTRT
jgi:phage replication initiation protein